MSDRRRQARIKAADSVTLDSSGDGQVTLGPVPAHSVWEIVRLTVHIDGTVIDNPNAQAFIYDSTVTSPENLVDGTIAGGMDVAEYQAEPIVLMPSQYLTVKWTGGTAAKVATARLTGWQIPQDQYFR